MAESVLNAPAILTALRQCAAEDKRLRADLAAAELQAAELREGIEAVGRLATKLRALLETGRSLDLDAMRLLGGTDGRTHYERITVHLVSSGPQSISEIEAAVGICRSSVSAVLYRTHADQFAKAGKGPTGALWDVKRAPTP